MPPTESLDRSLRILLLERSAADARLEDAHLHRVLGGAHRVAVATLEEGLGRIGGEAFDVVVLDLGMTEAGPEVFGRLRALVPSLPIVVLAAVDDADAAERALRAGAQDVLPQAGLTVDSFRRAVRHAIARTASAQRFRDLFEHSAGFVCLHTADGTLRDVNPQGAQCLDYAPSDMVGRNLKDFVPSDFHDRVDQYFATVQSEGAAEGTLVLEDRRGRRHVIQYRNRLQHGSPDGAVIGHGIDITKRLQVEDALKHALAELRAVHDASPLGLFRSDATGALTYANAMHQQLSGGTPAQLAGLGWFDFIHPEDRAAVAHGWSLANATQQPYRGEHRLLRADGTVTWVRVHAKPFEHEESGFGYVGTLEDISEARLAEAAMERQLVVGAAASDVIPVELMFVRPSTRVAWLNERAARACGAPRTELLHRRLRAIWPEERYRQLLDLIRQSPPATAIEAQLLEARDGEERIQLLRVVPEYGSEGRLSGAYVALQDVTDRERHERSLLERAERDQLTGLLNRAGLMARLERADRRARDNGWPLALFYIDLDGFKPVNDTHGHAAGDAILREAADRLTAAVRSSDPVARMGGDEFVVFMENAMPNATASIADSFAERLGTPYAVGDLHIVGVSASVGWTVRQGGSQSVAELLAQADEMLYAVKKAKRDRKAARA